MASFIGLTNAIQAVKGRGDICRLKKCRESSSHEIATWRGASKPSSGDGVKQALETIKGPPARPLDAEGSGQSLPIFPLFARSNCQLNRSPFARPPELPCGREKSETSLLGFCERQACLERIRSRSASGVLPALQPVTGSTSRLGRWGPRNSGSLREKSPAAY